MDLSFKKADLDSMKVSVDNQRKMFIEMRKSALPNDLPFSMVFNPPINNAILPDQQTEINWQLKESVKLPKDKNELAFFSCT